MEKESKGWRKLPCNQIGFEFVIGSRSNRLGPSSCAGGSGREKAAVKNMEEIETWYFFLIACGPELEGREKDCNQI